MKKNERFRWERKVPIVEKLLRIMKLTTFLLLVSALGVLANKSYSQTMNLKMDNATLKEVLSKIEDMSECNFLYSEKFVDVQRKVSVNFENTKIDDALRVLFADTGIEFERKDRIVILSQNTEASSQQPQDISGRITDSSGAPLPGVTVVIKGTTKGTITDFDGNYSLSNVPEDASLVFSFVGMKPQEVLVGQNTYIDIVMDEETIGIEEVVAIGYGVQKKINLTGAVEQVTSEILEDRPVANVQQAIQGVLPSMNFSVGSAGGEPGASMAMNIRGVGSLDGTDAPYILVDGVPVNSINVIECHEQRKLELCKRWEQASRNRRAGAGSKPPLSCCG
jgi:TonB-dependent starch-binding outer membrane protein SusC